MKRVFILWLSSLFFFCAPVKGQKIQEKEAINLAEDFIRRNGYTEMPIDTSKQKLSFSLNESRLMESGYYNRDSVIKSRYNSLYPQAKYILYDAEWKRWHVGFIYTDIQLDKIDTCNKKLPLHGNTVIIDEVNDQLRMSHLNPILKFFKRLP